MTTLTVKDDGAGALTGYDFSTVDYATGELVIQPQINTTRPQPNHIRDDDNQRFVFSGWTYGTAAGSVPIDQSFAITYAYGDAQAAVQESFTLDLLALDLTPGRVERAVPGSLRLGFGGQTYVDAAGAIYTGVDPATGAGTLAGTLDYAAGRATLTAWTAGTSDAPYLDALVTRLGDDVVDEVTFRTPGSPVQVGSVYVQATDSHGNLISDTADSQGLFSAAGIEGRFDYQAGVGRVRFGDWVTAAGNEGEPWYHAANVVNGQIWQPRWVIAETLTYNGVTTSYLPVDADILGLEPERLPGDGKVPIFAPGMLAVVHHTGIVAAASPAAGASVDLGRERLARVWVRDSAKLKVPGHLYHNVLDPDTGLPVETLLGQNDPNAQWRVNLDAGLFEWADPLDLTGFTGPYALYHRIWHKSRIRDVDISGRLILRQPLNHDYPAGSLVSSALVIGDLQGRVSLLPFAQTTWTNEWSDSRIGDEPLAQYNPQFPIQPTNNALKDRYAIRFVTSTSYQLYSENRGLLTPNPVSINEDFSLYNPLTNDLEFALPLQALSGGGWGAGNVIRFNLEGGSFPFQVALTILEGPSTTDLDQFTLEFMGDTTP
jgi:hypothetical protein